MDQRGIASGGGDPLCVPRDTKFLSRAFGGFELCHRQLSHVLLRAFSSYPLIGPLFRALSTMGPRRFAKLIGAAVARMPDA